MQVDFSSIEKIKPRVLIVDNLPGPRVMYQSFLMDLGYEPVLVMGGGATLLANARREAYEKRCALALIDLRLMDDDDDQDTSGLTLAEELGDKLRPIILSGYENITVLKTLLQKHKDIEFINKKTDSPSVLEGVLNREAAKVTAAKRKLVFDNPQVLEEIAGSALGQQTGGYSDQIADLFAQLFPNAKELTLEKLEIRPASSNISTVPRPTSVVLKVREGDYEPIVVKIARADKIKKEVDNYNAHIFRRLTGGFSARLERSSLLWDIGAASYSYVGKFDVITFSRFYEEKSTANIRECLNSFFGDLWGNHYDNAQNITDVSLFKLYSEVWGEWYEKWIKGFSSSGFKELKVLNERLHMPEPIQWFKEKIVESSNDQSLVNKTRVAITHGDLHGDNMLVDNKMNVWVIDFERCGKGHILQDFIELESDIINRLEAQNDNFPAYFKMCLSVLKHKNLQEFDPQDCLCNDPNVDKAIQIISVLRGLALKHTQITDMREYLYGLLFNMLFRAAMVQKKSPQKSERALLLASLICHRLDHWDDEIWPPAELNLA
jgi:thiamine kinase-like enzyme/CheY-like chemotaxis protein